MSTSTIKSSFCKSQTCAWGRNKKTRYHHKNIGCDERCMQQATLPFFLLLFSLSPTQIHKHTWRNKCKHEMAGAVLANGRWTKNAWLGLLVSTLVSWHLHGQRRPHHDSINGKQANQTNRHRSSKHTITDQNTKGSMNQHESHSTWWIVHLPSFHTYPRPWDWTRVEKLAWFWRRSPRWWLWESWTFCSGTRWCKTDRTGLT